jgi:hypothetical protein
MNKPSELRVLFGQCSPRTGQIASNRAVTVRVPQPSFSDSDA